MMGATVLLSLATRLPLRIGRRDAEVVADMYEDNAIFESKPRNAGSRDSRDPIGGVMRSALTAEPL